MDNNTNIEYNEIEENTQNELSNYLIEITSQDGTVKKMLVINSKIEIKKIEGSFSINL